MSGLTRARVTREMSFLSLCICLNAFRSLDCNILREDGCAGRRVRARGRAGRRVRAGGRGRTCVLHMQTAKGVPVWQQRSRNYAASVPIWQQQVFLFRNRGCSYSGTVRCSCLGTLAVYCSYLGTPGVPVWQQNDEGVPVWQQKVFLFRNSSWGVFLFGNSISVEAKGIRTCVGGKKSHVTPHLPSKQPPYKGQKNCRRSNVY